MKTETFSPFHMSAPISIMHLKIHNRECRVGVEFRPLQLRLGYVPDFVELQKARLPVD